jgi:serine/threonine protein kinase
MAAWSDYYQRRQSVEDGLLTGDYVIRVGDFGLCRGIFEASGFIQEGESRYCPRELINLDHTHLDLTKADVFSLAASVYELCLGRFLGASGEEGMEEWHNVRDGLFASDGWYTAFSPSLTGLIGRMLHPDPRRRPSAEEVVSLARDEVAQAQAKMSAATSPTATATSTTDVLTKKEMEAMSHAELVALAQRLQTEHRHLLQQTARST